MTRTVSEQADTCITTGATSITVQAELSELLKGDTITQDTPTDRIITELSKGIVKTQVVRKEAKIPVKINKTTTEQFKGDQKVKEDIHTVEKDKDVKRTGGFNFNWLWLILAALIAFLLWRFVGFRKVK